MKDQQTNQQQYDDEHSWNGYSKMVLSVLDRHEKCLGEIMKTQTDILIEIATLKVKSGLWGASGSAVAFLLLWGLKQL